MSQGRLLENDMKTYSTLENVGKCRYVVNYHDGLKTHHDGSPFFDIAIFRNKRKAAQFVVSLKRLGYSNA